MKQWLRRRTLVIVAGVLIVVGAAPLAFLYWFASTHNFQPLSMALPLKQGEYTSAVFKTDLDENYMVQIELADPNRQAIGLNENAFLDLDWKIVDAGGTVLQQGTENTLLRGANNVNLGEYRPKRGERQKLIVDVHREIEEPEGSRVTLEVNSTEDPEGRAIGAYVFAWWAGIIAGPGAILPLVLLVLRMVRKSPQQKSTVS
jgi:hypothetical protein